MNSIVKTTAISILIVATFIPQLQAGTIKGRISATKKKELHSVVAFVDSVKGDYPPPKDHVLMDQKNLKFEPHILPVLAGTTVDFRNSDDVAHNVFTPDKNADKFNLGTWPKGEIRSHTFEQRCEDVCDAVMLCNVHPEMEAFVLIMRNPFFAVANDSGYFEIPDVPAGQHIVQAWHPKLKAEPVTVEVPDSGSVQIEFSLEKKK